MEYAKDEIFNIRYNSLTGTLECGTSHKNKLRRVLKQYKFAIILGVIAMGLSISNVMMIIKFVENLTKI